MLTIGKLPNEIWKPITGYRGRYLISNLGRIKSLGRYWEFNPKVIILKQYIGIHGYYQVSLYKKGNRYNAMIHRIMAQEFLKNPHHKEEVNHIDGDKLNNCLSNLNWMTKSENMCHARDLGLLNMEVHKGILNSQAKLTNSQVYRIKWIYTFSNNDYHYWPKVAKSLKVNRSSINRIHRKELWKYLELDKEG